MTQSSQLPVISHPTRLAYAEVAPHTMAALSALQSVVNRSNIEKPTVELAKLRASQINGCSFCLDMHFRDAVAAGEQLERLYLLDAWEESPVYTARERAALRWTEAVTRLSEGGGVSDEVFAEARREFSEQELSELTLALVAINAWNRFNVAFRTPPALKDSNHA